MALISSLPAALISNGILRSRTTVFINTVIAAVVVKPNSSQRVSKFFFNELS